MKDDCCFPLKDSQSWIDIQHAKPAEILDLIANAAIGVTTGTFANSSNYGTPGSWAANTFTITSAPTCAALGTDNLAKVANAAQWNFDHTTANVASTNAIPLRKIIFLRSGTEWEMTIPISLGGSTYTDLQLSFLTNAGTRGDAQGTVPVIQWTGSFTGDVSMKVTLKTPGQFTMGLRAVTGGNASMFEMQWIVTTDKLESKPQLSLSNLEVQSFRTSAGGPGGPNVGGEQTPIWTTCSAISWYQSCMNTCGGSCWGSCDRCCDDPNWSAYGTNGCGSCGVCG